MLQAEKITPQDAKWYGVTDKHFLVSVDGKGWFPTKKIAGVDRSGKYYDKYNIGLAISGNMGSAFVAVLDIEKTKELLNQ